MKDTIESLAAEMAAKFPGVSAASNERMLRSDIASVSHMPWNEDEKQWGELGKRLNAFIREKRAERMKGSQ